MTAAWPLILAATMMGLSAVIGGATGFGSSLVAAPLLLLDGLPLPQVVMVNLTATLVTRLAVLYRTRAEVSWRRVAVLGGASVPGAWLGAQTLHEIPPQYLRVGAGVLVVLSGLRLLLRAAEHGHPATALRQAVAGLCGGYLSTTTSLNGAPPAILLSSAAVPQRAFIADLAGYFVVTNALSLAVLGIRGQITAGALWPVLPVLTVAALIGNQLGGLLIDRFSPTLFRRLVVAVVMISGLMTALSA